MSRENQSYLRFSLEESVWFQKGHEVAELYSISLDPNVTIQERDQYVVIKGTLDLSGEYKEERGNGESVIKNYTQHYHPKTVHEVERGETGINEFTHRFPVDITIPFNRIHSLQEVDVEIQTFDYTLPEKNCLKLQADLLITGIYREQDTISDNNDRAYDEETDNGYVQPEEDYKDNFNDTSGNEYIPQRYEYEEGMEEREAENISQHNEEPFETFEEYIRKSGAFQNLKGEAEYQRENEQSETLFERSLKQDESFAGGYDNELYTPFFAEAKKLPEEGRSEDTEPALMSKQPDIPVFEIPVEPLYDELNSKMQITQKQPETAHPWADLIQHGSFDIDEPQPDKQEPQDGEQDLLQAQEQQESAQQKPPRVEMPEAAAPQEPEREEKPKAAAPQEPVRAEKREDVPPQQPARAEKKQVQEEAIEDSVQAQQKQAQDGPAQDAIQAEQESAQKEPIQASGQSDDQHVPEEPVPASARTEQEPIQEEPIKDDIAPILNLARREETPSAQEDKYQNGQSSVNREKEKTNEDDQLSLMDFFGRKQEEELTKVKVCIVQHGDTISSLADRYEVSVQSLLSSNALDQDQDVSEGQVLYIPRAKAIKF